MPAFTAVDVSNQLSMRQTTPVQAKNKPIFQRHRNQRAMQENIQNGVASTQQLMGRLQF